MHTLRLSLLCSALVLLASACHRDEQDAPAQTERAVTGEMPSSHDNTPATEGTGEAPAQAASASAAGVEIEDSEPAATEPEDSLAGPNFTIVAPPLTVPVGTESHLELQVAGHSGFHINLEYPWRLRLEQTEGLSLGALEWDSSSASSFTAERAVFLIPVTATSPGQYEVNGQIRFSLCSESRCDVPRRDIRWTITAL